jgi:hypothetical protein
MKRLALVVPDDSIWRSVKHGTGLHKTMVVSDVKF